MDLLALGDPCADLVVAAEEPPRSGEKVLGRSLEFLPAALKAT